MLLFRRFKKIKNSYVLGFFLLYFTIFGRQHQNLGKIRRQLELNLKELNDNYPYWADFKIISYCLNKEFPGFFYYIAKEQLNGKKKNYVNRKKIKNNIRIHTIIVTKTNFNR